MITIKLVLLLSKNIASLKVKIYLGMLEGNFENGYISLGNGISAIDRVKIVQELIDELMG